MSRARWTKARPGTLQKAPASHPLLSFPHPRHHAALRSHLGPPMPGSRPALSGWGRTLGVGGPVAGPLRCKYSSENDSQERTLAAIGGSAQGSLPGSGQAGCQAVASLVCYPHRQELDKYSASFPLQGSHWRVLSRGTKSSALPGVPPSLLPVFLSHPPKK